MSIVFFMIFFSEKTFQASMAALRLWWDILIPIMLPIWMIGQICLQTCTSIIFHPSNTMMADKKNSRRKLLLWIWLHVFCANQNAAVQTISLLQKENIITPQIARKWFYITHVYSPVWIVNMVGIGFWQNKYFGIFLGITYYLSAFIIYLIICYRDIFFVKKEVFSGASLHYIECFIRKNIHLHQMNFGAILKDAVNSSVQQIFICLGYLLCSSIVAQFAIEICNLPIHIAGSIFNVYLGLYAYSQMNSMPMQLLLACASACMAWGGLSSYLHSTITSETLNLRFFHFFLLKGLHSCIAFGLTYWLWPVCLSITSQKKEAYHQMNMVSLSQTFNSTEHISYFMLILCIYYLGIVLTVIFFMKLFAYKSNLQK